MHGPEATQDLGCWGSARFLTLSVVLFVFRCRTTSQKGRAVGSIASAQGRKGTEGCLAP